VSDLQNSSGGVAARSNAEGHGDSNGGRKSVVLGAGGFVGGAMVERLVNRGSHVTPVIHRIGPGSAFLARFGLQQRIADLGDPAALKNVFEGADTVFHCVAGDRAATVQGLTNCLAAAQAAGIRRFIYLSSAVVHGFRPSSALVETSPMAPAAGSEYAENKAAAEKIIAGWRGGPETVALRPSIIYGPRSKYWSEYPARQIVSGTAYLVDEGRGYMNDIHIEHLLDAMLLAAHHPKAANQTYVLQDGFALTWRDYYGALCELLGTNINSLANFSLDEVRRGSSKLRQYGQWATDTPSVLRSALWHDPIKAWLKRAPGFESVRRRMAAGKPATTGKRGSDGDSHPIAPELDIAMLQTFPQPIVDSKIRQELGFAPRLSFAETLDGLGRWYRFMGLVR
jgi:nucleoside-diphosphate-sugar epimerase